MSLYDIIMFRTIQNNSSVNPSCELTPMSLSPPHRLRLAELLGSGAFGMVIKGEAADILDMNGPTTVAVKMLKGSQF